MTPHTNVSAELRAGGICPRHGAYIGRRCPGCSKRASLVKLSSALWELGGMSDEELLAYVKDVLAEIRSDEP